MNGINKGFCYRCEYRARFYETGHAPRCECGNINSSVCSCYQYKPVTPCLLLGDKTDPRPQFGPALISSRSRSGGLADCRLSLKQDKEGSTLYWTPKSLDDVHTQAQKTIWFLECHPAMGGRGIWDKFFVQIERVDKRGRNAPFKGMESVYWSPKNYKRFKKEFDKEFKECEPFELKHKPLISVDIPYETVYGEKWTFDHIEYWGELCFMAFMGKDFKADHDRTKWQHLSGVETGGRSFQEMMINIGVEFKKAFGNFNKESFYTIKEKNNHKKENIFSNKKGPVQGVAGLFNPKYIRVKDSEMNRRWWKWFAKTDYCKKKWGSTAKGIIAGKEHLE